MSQIKAHTYITGKNWMSSLKFATDFMNFAMNIERLNMGEVVGEMKELILIQI